ncbi:CLUMA_CG011390, isoform A [Clunio marinus]|uniref:CLUMA_CG011390, isoform A n=1 Tax=Clunio marinus TaxID=568069 RepID=A0A1J1ICL0_9DIPT|nr:CLUMA_CG011390, isoform A [Clunio marinus]
MIMFIFQAFLGTPTMNEYLNAIADFIFQRARKNLNKVH